jgi:electron transfer flavoprotein beta subunit
MHTVVAIKQVPDTSNVRINPDTGTLIREGVPAIINPYDVHAVEMAVRLKERFGGQVTVITMGPPKASEALIECVEQGADRCILITDRRFAAADTLATSYVLAHTIEALQAEGPVDLCLFGLQAIDGDTAQVGPGVATRLEMPLITYATHIESFDPDTRTAVVHRLTERGIEVLQTRLPALLTVEKEITPIKRAPLANMIKAVRYQPEVWSANEPVPFDPDRIGIKGSPTIVGRAYTPPPRQAGGMVNVAEAGAAACVQQALERIAASGVVDLKATAGAGRPSSGNGGVH